MEWKRSWGKRNKPSPTIPKADLHPRRWFCIYGEIGRESSIMSSFRKTKWFNSNRYYSHETKKQHFKKKHSELVNRKLIIFHQDNARWHAWWLNKSCYSLAEKFWFICRIHQTLHLWMSHLFCFFVLFSAVPRSLGDLSFLTRDWTLALCS